MGVRMVGSDSKNTGYFGSATITGALVSALQQAETELPDILNRPLQGLAELMLYGNVRHSHLGILEVRRNRTNTPEKACFLVVLRWRVRQDLVH